MINEGHAPRYAIHGSQPTSKPVAPVTVIYILVFDWAKREKFKRRAGPSLCNTLTASQNPCLVALPVAVFVSGALVMLLFTLGEADGELGAPILPV